ncbi:MAG: hypothetical protein ACFCUI_01475 [Bernardetiaceae bacterium]
MDNHWLYIALLLLIGTNTQAQLPPLRSLHTNGQHCYALTQTEEVLLLDTAGKIERRFAAPAAIPLTSMDFSHRWKVFLFSEETQSVLFLDRFLVLLDRLTLPEDFGWITLTAPSADQTLWLFAQDRHALVRYDMQRREWRSQSSLSGIIPAHAHLPDQLSEYQNLLFLNIPESGIFVFDMFGSFREQLPFWASSAWQFLEQQLCFHDKASQQMICWDIYRREQESLPVPAADHILRLPRQADQPAFFCLPKD